MPGRRRREVCGAWWVMVARIWEVVRRGVVGVGGLIRIKALEGSRLWERIWDSTANWNSPC
jgi:hypothetical protein